MDINLHPHKIQLKGTDINSHLHKLQLEFSGVNARVNNFYADLRKAHEVIILMGCDDSREDVPVRLVEIPDRKLKVGFLFVPVLGGGVPDGAVLRAVHQKFRDEQIPADKISFMTTQHGNTQEVQHALEEPPDTGTKITCGARKARAEGTAALPSELAELISALESDMIENGLKSFRALEQMLPQLGIKAGLTCGLYDHELKTVAFLDRHGNKTEQKINLGLNEWHESFQDPAYVVISAGIKAAAVPHGVAFPLSIGVKGNNDFNITAADTAGLLRALAEAEYPLLHAYEHRSPRGHAHDLNFKNLSGVIALCDDTCFVEKLQNALTERPKFRELVASLFGGFFIARLDTEGVQYLTLSRSEAHAD